MALSRIKTASFIHDHTVSFDTVGIVDIPESLCLKKVAETSTEFSFSAFHVTALVDGKLLSAAIYDWGFDVPASQRIYPSQSLV